MRVNSYSYKYRPTCRRLLWISFAQLLTLFIPDFILKYGGGLTTSASRIAWREKIALLFLNILTAALFYFWLEFLSSFFCDPEKTYDYNLVYSNESKLAGIHGKAVHWAEYSGTSEVADFVVQYPHHDLSLNFPRFMLLQRNFNTPYTDSIMNNCIFYRNQSVQADAWLDYYLSSNSGYDYRNKRLLQCPLPDHTNITGGPCFYGPEHDHLVRSYKVKGDIKYDPKEISRSYNGLPYPGNTTKQGYVILDGNVLDVTAYLDAATNIIPLSSTLSSRAFALDRMFLPLDLTIFLYINLGKDISEYFNSNVSDSPDIFRACLIHLFSKGVVPSYAPSDCSHINPALWATMGVGLLYFLLKMNLAYLSRVPFIQQMLTSSDPEYSSLSQWPHTLLFIPCYTESSETLKQTLDALSRTAYDDSKKLLLFVCDGLVAHQDNKYTHILLLESLGYSSTEEPSDHPYISLGQNQKRMNYARVYSGFYETGRNRVPYIVIVKTGHPTENNDMTPPGNRGKRDSLVIVMSFLERCMNLGNNMITSLDYELFNQCFNVLGIDPRCFKYLMVTDADIQVRNDAVQKMVRRLEKDKKMLAVSGHIRPANPEENLTTMIQIFPAYMTYFSGLAYETCLRAVMSINCGLVMYKIWSEVDPGHRIHTMPEPPKASEEETNPFNDTVSECSSIATTTTRTTTGGITDPIQRYTSSRPVSQLSLAVNYNMKACCIHPTVLRGLAIPQADTMHMQNVLLLGEDRFLAVILLKSHPQHRLGFEPEAVGYTTLPTDFFSLQGIQTRNIRAAFHNQLELQRVSWQLGFMYWVLSTLELLDMVFSAPIIVYLYSVFVRALKSSGMSYTIIACAFTGLIVLHIIFFACRRQFRYILWFVLYCLASVPLFAVWFPLLAVWQSNYAERWYDALPNCNRRGPRLHGIIDLATSSNDLESEEKNVDEKGMLPRMRLKEYEIREARRVHQAAEAALDSNFVGFTCFTEDKNSLYSVIIHRNHKLNNEKSRENEIIATLPTAQIRDGVHSTRLTTLGSVFPMSSMDTPNNNWKNWYADDEKDSISEKSPTGLFNPFSDIYIDNPFDDEYAVPLTKKDPPTERQHKFLHHRPSRSQSSYYTSYTASSDTPLNYRGFSHINDTSTVPTSLNSSGFAKIPGYPEIDTDNEDTASTPSVHPYQEEDTLQDRTSILSIASNTFSLQSTQSPRFDPLNTHLLSEEGRSVALHHKITANVLQSASNINLRQPTKSIQKPASKSKRKKGMAVTSSQSLSRHFRDTSDTLHIMLTPEMSVSEVRIVIKREVRAYLQKSDLSVTTKTDVEQYVMYTLGHRVQEMTEFVDQCIDEITQEFLVD
ncbi:chitin synthase-domain-containing protein [Pilobolus umbonatus]|nr:chitin synthase-domain-containing protein [Pilobolus umbonatus]